LFASEGFGLDGVQRLIHAAKRFRDVSGIEQNIGGRT
jgi:hypothetical protein